MNEELKALLDELKGLMSKQADEVKALGEVSEQSKKEFETLTAKIKEVETELKNMQASQKRKGYSLDGEAKTLGQMFSASDKYKEAVKNDTGVRVNFDVTSKDADGNIITPKRRSDKTGILPVYPRLRDILNVVPTSEGSIEYVVETGFTNNAGAQAGEGAVKGKSNIELKVKVAPMATIAHTINISKQSYKDGAVIANYIDNRLINGLEIKEDYQILNGTGEDGEMVGILNTDKVQVFPDTEIEEGDTRIDIIRKAITKSKLAGYPVDAIILNPIDYEQIELTKGSNGHYILISMGDSNGIWKVPVIETPAIDAGTFLLGAFNSAATLWDREEAAVEVGNQHGDNFVQNMLTLLAEERLTVTVERPEAFVKGTFEPGEPGEQEE